MSGMTIDVNTEKLAAQIANQVLYHLSFALNRKLYPLEIKGDTMAGELIGVSGDAMKQRRVRGFYQEGHHFYKKSDKIVMWFRDALLEDWSLQNGKALFSS